MLHFSNLFYDSSLHISKSELTRWEQGRIIPAQILQKYWDEGIPFVPTAPTTAMRLQHFLARLDILAKEHEYQHIRQLADFVRNDISRSVYGFSCTGKPNSRRIAKLKMNQPRYK